VNDEVAIKSIVEQSPHRHEWWIDAVVVISC
jgi:hypothetical protein